MERDVLGAHLRARGYESLQDAVASNDQVGSFDPADFSEFPGGACCQGARRSHPARVYGESSPERAAHARHQQAADAGRIELA